MNWAKLYDNEKCCLIWRRRTFCGCRWDNIEWCYECIDDVIKKWSLFRKICYIIYFKYMNLIYYPIRNRRIQIKWYFKDRWAKNV